jgi:XRE family transcriptional regulator, regulator of sulfur utilization
MAPPRSPQPALGQAVRQLRTERGLTQEQLAHAADLHPTWISQLESGNKNPSWASVSRLAAALGLRLSQLAAVAEDLMSR